MLNFPFYPFYRRNYMYPYGYSNFPYNNYKKVVPTHEKQKEKVCSSKTKSTEYKSVDNKNENVIFEFFGIKLFSDDMLIIGLLFFLYKEKVDDQYLFIALIMLLLS